MPGARKASRSKFGLSRHLSVVVVADPAVVNSKRVGLEKALYQVEQAIKRARTGQQQSSEDDIVLSQLSSLVNRSAANDETLSQPSSSRQRSAQPDDPASSDDGRDGTTDHTSMSEFAPRPEESLAVDDAENPLQLLARASYFQPSRDVRASPLQNRRKRAHSARQSPEPSALEAFFTSVKVNLDVGSDIDPIDLGLVSEEEAESLFV